MTAKRGRGDEKGPWEWLVEILITGYSFEKK